MAKASTPVPNSAAPAVAPAFNTIGGFAVIPDFDLPARTAGRPAGAKENPLRLALQNIPLNAAIVLRPDAPVDTITDPAEREKAWKENAKEKAKAVSGTMRNVTKANAQLAFESRTMLIDADKYRPAEQHDGKGVTYCVVVKRVVPKPATPAVTVASGQAPTAEQLAAVVPPPPPPPAAAAA